MRVLCKFCCGTGYTGYVQCKCCKGEGKIWIDVQELLSGPSPQ